MTVTVGRRVLGHGYEKSGLWYFWSEVLKTRIAQIACGSHMPDFLVDGHILFHRINTCLAVCNAGKKQSKVLGFINVQEQVTLWNVIEGIAQACTNILNHPRTYKMIITYTSLYDQRPQVVDTLIFSLVTHNLQRYTCVQCITVSWYI